MKKKLLPILFLTLLITACNPSSPSSEIPTSSQEPSISIEASSEISSSETSSETPVSSETSSSEEQPSSQEEPPIPSEPSLEEPSSSEDVSSISSEESSSEEISSETSEPSSESESSSEEPISYTLDTPILTIDNNTGLVSWEKIEDAEYYRYYVNNDSTHTTTLNSLVIPAGSVISVCAESSLEHVRTSAWSNPISYFEPIKETETINIYFYNTSLSPVTILKGDKYIPATPTKDNYTFHGWYLDPYFKEQLNEDYRYYDNTILYANFVKDDWCNDVTYFIKANPSITSEIISTTTSSSGWRFIPLKLDDELSKQYNKRIFSSIVNVTSANAAYLIMDGTHDGEGRTYYKNNGSDFTITSIGTYKICFSVEYSWNNVNSTSIKLSNETSTIYDCNQYPQFVIDTTSELETPVIQIDDINETASWNIIENADYYEYIIDNEQILITTSNNIPLYQGSFITVRACHNDNSFLPSRWSIPGYQEIKKYPSSISVYFYDSSRPSVQIPYGGKIAKPTNNPTKDGYLFENWYENITHTTVFDFDKPLYENTVIYPKYELIDSVKFQLYLSNKTTKLADFEISNQYGYNEYVATYTVSNDLNVYVKSLKDNIWFGPYTMSSKGEYTMYFSDEHKWDVDTNNERNAYWTKTSGGNEEYTLYFSNNQNWSSIHYYVWGDNGYMTSWPGDNMTFVRQNSYGQDIYKCTFSNTYTNIIFNNGSGEQTIDISLNAIVSGTGFYLDNKTNGKWTVQTYTYGE